MQRAWALVATCLVVLGCELLPAPAGPLDQQGVVSLAEREAAGCGSVSATRLDPGPPPIWTVTIEAHKPESCGPAPPGKPCADTWLVLTYDGRDGRLIGREVGCALTLFGDRHAQARPGAAGDRGQPAAVIAGRGSERVRLRRWAGR